MLEWVTGVMDSAGYLGIVFLMFLENVFPPIPSEVVMPLAGFTAGQGKLNLIGVIVAGMVGSVLGALPLYYLGKVAGEERVKSWADKYGAWLAVSGEDVTKAKKWFDEHGEKAVFLGRLVPGVRSLVSLPAGMSGMEIGKFLLYSAPGTLLWAGVLAFLGQLLGKNYETVGKFLGPATYVIMGGILLAWFARIIKAKPWQKNGGKKESGDDGGDAARSREPERKRTGDARA
jgi:membrane protein DedA with SNARE-associated domain